MKDWAEGDEYIDSNALLAVDGLARNEVAGAKGVLLASGDEDTVESVFLDDDLLAALHATAAAASATTTTAATATSAGSASTAAATSAGSAATASESATTAASESATTATASETSATATAASARRESFLRHVVC